MVRFFVVFIFNNTVSVIFCSRALYHRLLQDDFFSVNFALNILLWCRDCSLFLFKYPGSSNLKLLFNHFLFYCPLPISSCNSWMPPVNWFSPHTPCTVLAVADVEGGRLRDGPCPRELSVGWPKPGRPIMCSVQWEGWVNVNVGERVPSLAGTGGCRRSYMSVRFRQQKKWGNCALRKLCFNG